MAFLPNYSLKKIKNNKIIKKLVSKQDRDIIFRKSIHITTTQNPQKPATISLATTTTAK